MPDTTNITISINGKPVTLPAGSSVAAAVLTSGTETFFISPSGEARGPVCGMGICYGCPAEVNGRRVERSCQVACADGMTIKTLV